MSKMGFGYGSEWHLLRYLGYHRQSLNKAIEAETGGVLEEWLDSGFDPNARLLDAEWKGMDFLEEEAVREEWKRFWPQTGNVHNWDAVGRLKLGEEQQWLLVEAKAHLAEIKSTCKAKPKGGLDKIGMALDETRMAVCDESWRNWLGPYYQYANRLAALHFLTSKGVAARLLFIYFTGDGFPKRSCPESEAEWKTALDKMHEYLGLQGVSDLEKRVHQVFLPVCGRSPAR